MFRRVGQGTRAIRRLARVLGVVATFCLLYGHKASKGNAEEGVLRQQEGLMAVFHVDETAKWSLALTNLENVLNEIGEEKAKLELVANAEAVKGFLDPSLTSRMEALNSRGVRFMACRNALKAFDLEPASLPGFIQVVPAGVVELIRKQSEGYAYVRP
jgi:hypothetical protein